MLRQGVTNIHALIRTYIHTYTQICVCMYMAGFFQFPLAKSPHKALVGLGYCRSHTMWNAEGMILKPFCWEADFSTTQPCLITG